MGYRFNDKEHIHTLDGKPLIGTSTVVSVISKPLTWWASGLAVKTLGWTNPKETPPDTRLIVAEEKMREIAKMEMDNEPEKYLTLLDKAYRAHADSLTKSADKGTDMHAALEDYVKACIEVNHGEPMVALEVQHGATITFSNWSKANVKTFLVSEGHCYSERLWTGGITDCIAELKDGRTVIIDFKSSKEAYLSQFIQTGGYDIEATENGIFDEQGNQLLKLERPIDGYVIFPFGAVKVEPQFQFDTEGIKRGFESATVLYKLISNN